MAEILSETFSELANTVKELFAIWHYISDILVILELLNLMSQHGTYVGLILWIISAVVSGLVAEFLESIIPTPLRVFLKELR